MTAVALFYLSNFSTFTLKYRHQPPTAGCTTRRGHAATPLPCVPAAPVPMGPPSTTRCPSAPQNMWCQGERGCGTLRGSRHITQPGPQPDPLSGRSAAHHGWKVRGHKSRAAQSIKSARSDNFMGKMDSRQVRGCRQAGWMLAEGRAELWSLRDSPVLPGRTVSYRPSGSAGWAPAPLPTAGDTRQQDEALP